MKIGQWQNLFSLSLWNLTVGIYLLKVNNRNTRTRCEVCSKLTIKTPELCQWRHSGVFIVNFKHISPLVLVFLLLTLNMQLPAGFRPISVEANCLEDFLFDEELSNFFNQYIWIPQKNAPPNLKHFLDIVKGSSPK